MHTTTSRSLLTAQRRDYVGGYTDADVAELGAQDGAANLPVADTFGDNTFAHGAGLVTSAHTTQKALIAHELWAVLRDLDRRTRDARARFAEQASEFKRSLGPYKDAAIHRANAVHLRRALGLGAPRWWAPLALFGVVVALFFGEIGLLASALQSMGLSDTPLIAGIPFTDELHIAALATVVSLALLSHAVGDGLKTVGTTVHLRRVEIDARVRAHLPRVSLFSSTLSGVAGLGGVAAVSGMVLIRGEYLAQSGSAITSGPFILIQFALLAAAVFAVYHFSDPTAHSYTDAVRNEKRSSEMLVSALSAVEATVAEHNAAADARESEVMGAVHHVRIDHANAVRQAMHLYPRQVLHGLPEPVVEKLFAAGMPEIAEPSIAAIRAELCVPESAPPTPLNSEALHASYDAVLQSIREREAALDLLLDNRLLPPRPADEYDYPTVGADADEDRDEMPTAEHPATHTSRRRVQAAHPEMHALHGISGAAPDRGEADTNHLDDEERTA